eukprot:GHVP01063468.1.p1 GENE.GHVP01063468.1~~GHVP01063468.1.p1  ORF type:complete len:380 (-),score=76.20 GHVP01063468.1:282-1421(-)
MFIDKDRDDLIGSTYKKESGKNEESTSNSKLPVIDSGVSSPKKPIFTFPSVNITKSSSSSSFDSDDSQISLKPNENDPRECLNPVARNNESLVQTDLLRGRDFSRDKDRSKESDLILITPQTPIPSQISVRPTTTPTSVGSIPVKFTPPKAKDERNELMCPPKNNSSSNNNTKIQSPTNQISNDVPASFLYQKMHRTEPSPVTIDTHKSDITLEEIQAANLNNIYLAQSSKPFQTTMAEDANIDPRQVINALIRANPGNNPELVLRTLLPAMDPVVQKLVFKYLNEKKQAQEGIPNSFKEAQSSAELNAFISPEELMVDPAFKKLKHAPVIRMQIGSSGADGTKKNREIEVIELLEVIIHIVIVGLVGYKYFIRLYENK